jgi:hypothetical protein
VTENGTTLQDAISVMDCFMMNPDQSSFLRLYLTNKYTDLQGIGAVQIKSIKNGFQLNAPSEEIEYKDRPVLSNNFCEKLEDAPKMFFEKYKKIDRFIDSYEFLYKTDLERMNDQALKHDAGNSPSRLHYNGPVVFYI